MKSTATITFKDGTRKVLYKVSRVRYEGEFAIVHWEEQGWHGTVHEDSWPANSIVSITQEKSE